MAAAAPVAVGAAAGGAAVSGTTIASLVIAAASTAYSVYAQQQQASYQAKVEDQNRKTALLSAADAVHRGDIAADQARMRTRLMISEQRAKYAASGVELGSGTSLETTADTAAFGELDALTIQSNAAREAWGYVNQADEFKRKKALTKSAASYNTGTTLLTGGAQSLNIYTQSLK